MHQTTLTQSEHPIHPDELRRQRIAQEVEQELRAAAKALNDSDLAAALEHLNLAFGHGKAALAKGDFSAAAELLADASGLGITGYLQVEMEKESHVVTAEQWAGAQSLGSDIENHLRAAQAGQFLVAAREKARQGELTESELALQQTLRTGENCTPAFEIVREAHRLLTEIASSKVSGLIKKAQESANQLYLSKAESLVEQACGIVKQLQDNYPVRMGNPVKAAFVAETNRLQRDITMARQLWRTVTEAQSYLEQEDSTEAFRLLSDVLNRCAEENEITHEIRQRVIWLLEGKRFLKGEYEALERLLLQRIAYKRGDQDAWVNLRWVRAQRKFDEDWDIAQTRSRATRSTITKQIDVSRIEMIRHLQLWGGVSVLAAVTAIGFLGYALVFLLQWREPLTYLTTLPALLTGIAAPFVHNFYSRMISEVNQQTTQAIEQLKTYESEEDDRKKAMFSAVLADAQMPGDRRGVNKRGTDSFAEK